MKRIITGIMVGALALAGGASVGSSAYAATTPTLVISGGSTVFGLAPATITGTASTAGVVKFTVGGVAITGCDAVATTTVTPFVAKCSWVPAAAGPASLGGTLTPTDSANFTAVDATAITVKTGVPVQGVVSPIHLYVDQVLASGTSGALAPRFGISCAVTSEFIVGQTIVWRVYGNNEELGGAVLDSSNVAKAYIEVAGVADPIPLGYGNHSGVAFWTATLKTGAAPLYNTLGVINFKVTMIAKDTDTVKVMTTKLVRRMTNGVKAVDEAGKPVYDRVPAFRTVKLASPLKGAIGTWSSNFTPTSQLTLYAVPVAK